MSEERKFDPLPDPRLAEALRSVCPEPPLEAVDWDALARRIADAADLPLARLRGRAPWWAYAARWAGAVAPAAVAASVILALLIGAQQRAHRDRMEAAQRLQLEAAIGAAPSDDEVTTRVFAVVDRDELLRAAVEGP